MSIDEKQYLNLKQSVISFIDFDKSNGHELKYEEIESYIDRAFNAFRFVATEDVRKRLFIDIEYQFKIVHSEGHSIFDDYDEPHEWYSNSNINNSYFWPRYRSFLINSTSIDIQSINLLDNITLPEIMNCLGNPNDEFEGTRLKRGLIIGDVQSGKTATYSGLICKAADAGFKVVILLAGITENLRQQTQERIDEGIVGYSFRKNGRIEQKGRVGVGLDNKGLKATSFTSCARDFVGDCDKISSSLGTHNSLVLFVVKKNVTVLDKLFNWLKEQNMDPILGCVNHPMLLIDDEADNASVNTNVADVDPTRTNKMIRNICNLFKNATYVGFTATPFANVFIDPDSIDKMKQSDLFPEHFIYTLPTPSSYIGAEKIFFEDGEFYDNLRYISDIQEPDYSSDEYRNMVRNEIETLNEGPFYSRHKKDWNGILPDSLMDSVYCFFLANAVRDLRGQQSAPRSMLVNMSRFIKVQNIIKDKVDEIWESFIRTIRFDFSDDNNSNKKLSLYQKLQQLWQIHFSTVNDISFERVVKKQTLIAATEKIEIVVVNGSRSSGKLDYKANKSLRVIAVGGLALSRGLTLEGLLVSYFYRNTATFDVLMQMGRWFGYRRGYEDLFQIWTSKISADWYAEIARASRELKDDVKTMFDQKLTPKDFGIKVRDNCSELQITASNKMRSAFDLRVRYSYYGNLYDTPYISLNTKINKDNWNQVRDFSNRLFEDRFVYRFADVGKYKDEDVYSDEIDASRFFEDVPKDYIVDFLSKIKCSLVNMNFNTDNIIDFIKDNNTLGVDKWDVVFEGGSGDKQYDIDSLSQIKCVSRAIYEDDRRAIQISSRRRILGTREGKFALNIEDIQNAEDMCRQQWIAEGESSDDVKLKAIPIKAYFEYLPHRKPVLIIMLIQPNKANNDPTKPEGKMLKEFREKLGDEKIVAFAIGFPGIKEPEKAKRYMVNKRYHELYMQDDEENVEEIDNED